MKFLYENFLQFYLLALTSITQHIKKVSNVDLSNITAENNVWKYLTKNNVATYAGGENYYQYYFAYHVIGLNHDTLHKN
ncbi:hypothetical protein [Spiroplasma endosymbiont of Andrena trimmerana]|uniref:hypothetical protein n=1 Tax=Spiroplasma endosymbiont of Andrena trimmerana TaxID=3066316 RepID=UPI0030D4B6DA